MESNGSHVGARNEKLEPHEPTPTQEIGHAETPPLAEGTRSDIDARRTKGMCVATRCHTVDQFVSTFHRYCEDSAIFIPNARRVVGTILPFSFDLVDEQSVLVGVGTVVEEFTTVDNRFGRAGIVLSVQKLKRESIAVFKRMLVARSEAEQDADTPPPAFARAMTASIAIDEVRSALRPATQTGPVAIDVRRPASPTGPVAIDQCAVRVVRRARSECRFRAPASDRTGNRARTRCSECR